jgi:uncharacterized repeat protein (TIGR01451 family)
MRNTTPAIRVALIALAALVAFASSPGRAAAQTYDLSWHAPAGGGTPVASGGTYIVTGTAGQSDAGPALAGGPYSLTGGFWVGAAVAPATPVDSDLAITMNDSVDPVAGNQPFVYSVTVTNNGPAPATAINVAATLAPGLVFVDASGQGWTCHESGGIVTCTRSALAAGAAPVISIVVTAPASAAGPLTTVATVQGSEPDPSASNNSASETTTVTAAPATAPTITITNPTGGPSLTATTPTQTIEGIASSTVGIAPSDQPIAVERALYWDAGGVTWAAGTNATATRLP